MKQRLLYTLTVFAALATALVASAQAPPAVPPLTWRAGVATAEITPTENMWMAGYAARKKPSEGTAQPLYAKALALEDAAGTKFALVTLDLIGVRRDVRDTVAAKCQEQYGLPPERLLLNASHTHCGPEYRPRPGREAEAAAYQARLETTLISLVGHALDRCQPARLVYAKSRCGFAMNRRRNYALRPEDPNANRAPTFDGPVDHEVPVLAVYRAEKSPEVVVFGYACHNTTLSSVTIPPDEPRYLFNGDYAGFAQEQLQQAYPGATAMFVNGCSGDQNPYPRRDEVPGVLPLNLARHHGQTLAYSVIAALGTGPRAVDSSMLASIGDVELTRNGDKPSHKYPVQVVRMGTQLTLVALGSEATVEYSLRLKQEIQAPLVWVAGYSNDYSGYIPSRRVAVEGGYEAANDFTLDVESRIVGKVAELLKATPTGP